LTAALLQNAKVGAYTIAFMILLPELAKDCRDLVALAHGTKISQEWLGKHCSDFIYEDS